MIFIQGKDEKHFFPTSCPSDVCRIFEMSRPGNPQLKKDY